MAARTCGSFTRHSKCSEPHTLAPQLDACQSASRCNSHWTRMYGTCLPRSSWHWYKVPKPAADQRSQKAAIRTVSNRWPAMNPLDGHFRAVSGCPPSTAGNGQPSHALVHSYGQRTLHSFQLAVRYLALLTLPIALTYRLHAGHLSSHAEASARFFIFCYAAFAIPCMMQLDSCDHY